MNDPIDALGHYFGIDPLSSDLKSPFDEPNPTTNDSMFTADDYLLDLGPFSGPDFSCTTQHTHDDGCPIRCPEDTNSSSQYRGVAPPVPSSYAKGRAVSVSYPPFGYGHDSHLYSASGQLGFEQMMGWASQDPKQEPDDGFKFFHGYGAECSGTGCPGTYCPSSCTLPQCTGANQECPAEDQCSQISCLDSEHCTPPCDDEDCADIGSPCNDPHCLEPTEQTTPSGLYQFFSHAQQCNHTNTEHNAALALGNMRDPGPQDQPQDPDLVHFVCPIFGQTDSLEKLCGVAQPIPSMLEPPPLCPDVANDSPVTLTEHRSPDSGKKIPIENRCGWLIGDATQAITCGQVFESCEALNNHVCDEHVNILSSKDKYMCRWHECNRKHDASFASKNKLRRHITTHTNYKPFHCKYCQEGFSARQALDQHERCHSGLKPFVCDQPGCGKAFKQKSALTMHNRTHTGEKPLSCDVCGKKFGESSNLSKHRKIHSPGNKLKCPEPNCGKEFIRADQLRRHLETHEKKKDSRQRKARFRKKSLSNEGDAMKATAMTSEQYQFPLPIMATH
ncbi:hypothetical protein PG995_002161 [Apiospora arundinis]